MYVIQARDKVKLRTFIQSKDEEFDRWKKSAKTELEEAEVEAERKWKEWVEKEVQVKMGNVVTTERKKWQAKGKSLPVEANTSATQTDYAAEEVRVEPVEATTQTEEGTEVLERMMPGSKIQQGRCGDEGVCSGGRPHRPPL